VHALFPSYVILGI